MNILILEDCTETIELYSRILNAHTLNVHINGSIDLLGHDLIICDLQMPAVNGINVLDTLQQTHNDTPVLIVSGYSIDTLNVTRQKYSNVYAYAQKPVSPAALISAINSKP
jgi:CheY-like chemotaxis protein